MYTNFQFHADSESISHAQNIQRYPKRQKLLLGGAYRKAHLVDENGQPLHLANCNIAYSSHNVGTVMVILFFWYINVNIISTSNQLTMHFRRAY